MSEETKKPHNAPAKKDDKKKKPAPRPHQAPDESLPLIGGGGLLKMLENIIPLLIPEAIGDNGQHEDAAPEMPETPFDFIGDEDLDDADPVVQEFKNDTGGCKGLVRVIKIHGPDALEKVAELIDRLQTVRTAHRAAILRQIFASLKQAIRTANYGVRQAECVRALDRLLMDTPDAAEHTRLEKARAAILAGTEAHLDAASYRVKQVFAGYVPAANIRVAYLENPRRQEGEPYLMCPKAADQMGKSLPMPISSCRDNCIDSRVTKDGQVTCAYTHWLTKIADTQAKTNARLEVHRHPDNQANLLNVPEGERHVAANEEVAKQSWEARFDSQYPDRNKMRAEETLEARLSQEKLIGHQGEEPEARPLDERLHKPVVANQSREMTICPQRDENLGVQVERGHKDAPETPLEQQLEAAPEIEYGRHNDTAERPQEMHKKASHKVNKIDPASEDTLGEQIAQDHTPPMDDKTLEALLEDEHDPFTEEELDMLLDEFLAREREGKD